MWHGEKLGVFHIPTVNPVCLAIGTSLHLSPALQDPQLGFGCSMSQWEKGNLGILTKDLGWWELQKCCITQAATPSAGVGCSLKERDSMEGPQEPLSLPGKGHGRDIPQQSPQPSCQHREQLWA